MTWLECFKFGLLMLLGALGFFLATCTMFIGPWYELYAIACWADLFKPGLFGLWTTILYIPAITLYTCCYLVIRLLGAIEKHPVSKPWLYFTLLLWVPVFIIPGTALVFAMLGALCIAGAYKTLK